MIPLQLRSSLSGRRAPAILFVTALLIEVLTLTACGQVGDEVRQGGTSIPFLATLPAAVPPREASESANHIVFVSDRDGIADIYVMNADGTSLRRLTHSSGEDAWPSFSPDGKQVLYQSDVNGRAQIFVVGIDGQAPSNLSSSQSSDEFPSWSPDGTHIAFTSDREGHAAIFVMKSDGTGVTNLTDLPSNNWFPAWSPDGLEIAFISDRDGTKGNIYLMDTRGNNLRQLTTEPNLAAKPSWAPDSKRLAMFTDRGLYSINNEGNDLRRISSDGEDPAWSPDGRWIAFASRRNTGHLQLYVAAADGSSIRKISESRAEDWAPAWGP